MLLYLVSFYIYLFSVSKYFFLFSLIGRVQCKSVTKISIHAMKAARVADV